MGGELAPEAGRGVHPRTVYAAILSRELVSFPNSAENFVYSLIEVKIDILKQAQQLLNLLPLFYNLW